MECNVGSTEQSVRISAGAAAVIAALAVPLPRTARIGLLVFGIAELVTGATRYCPVKQLLGMNDCEDAARIEYERQWDRGEVPPAAVPVEAGTAPANI